MTSRVVVVVLVLLGAARGAGAQALPLPRLDSINIYVQTGRFLPKADLVTAEDSLLYGWGFETAFDVGPLGPKGRWLLELAVGYEQLSGMASRVNAYRVEGSVRDLPSVTAYVTDRDTGLYFGAKTGLVTLAHMNAVDRSDDRVYGVHGSTIMLGASVGWSYDFGLSVELSYGIRYFPGVSYDLPLDQQQLPDDLPQSIAMHGFTLAVGYQISLHRKPPAPPTPLAASRMIGATPEKLLTGPARLTSYGFATTGGGHARLYIAPVACTDEPTAEIGFVPGVQGEIVIPPGSVLCAKSDVRGMLSWTGFGP